MHEYTRDDARREHDWRLSMAGKPRSYWPASEDAIRRLRAGARVMPAQPSRAQMIERLRQLKGWRPDAVGGWSIRAGDLATCWRDFDLSAGGRCRREIVLITWRLGGLYAPTTGGAIWLPAFDVIGRGTMLVYARDLRDMAKTYKPAHVLHFSAAPRQASVSRFGLERLRQNRSWSLEMYDGNPRFVARFADRSSEAGPAHMARLKKDAEPELITLPGSLPHRRGPARMPKTAQPTQARAAYAEAWRGLRTIARAGTADQLRQALAITETSAWRAACATYQNSPARLSWRARTASAPTHDAQRSEGSSAPAPAEGIEPKLFIDLRQRGYIEESPLPSFTGNRKYFISATGHQALNSGDL